MNSIISFLILILFCYYILFSVFFLVVFLRVLFTFFVLLHKNIFIKF